MPTYEYECAKCGDVFERFQSIKDEALTRCPACRGKVRRLIGTGAGIIFKGSGFYQTDYRKPGYSEAAKKDKSGSSTETAAPAASGAKETAGAKGTSASDSKATKSSKAKVD